MGLEPRWAEVIENRALARDLHEIVLRPETPGGEPFRAGQYLLIRSGEEGERPFSIASSPSRPERLEFCVRRYPEGTVTPELTSHRPGDRLAYRGPLGGFATRPDDRRRLFIATGSGIAPLRSMILDLRERRDPAPALLLFGNRSREDLFYLEDFERIAAENPRFRFVPCLSRPGPEPWSGAVGRVTEVLPKLIEDGSSWTAYLCGRPEMIRDATVVLLELGVPPDRCRKEP